MGVLPQYRCLQVWGDVSDDMHAVQPLGVGGAARSEAAHPLAAGGGGHNGACRRVALFMCALGGWR